MYQLKLHRNVSPLNTPLKPQSPGVGLYQHVNVHSCPFLILPSFPLSTRSKNHVQRENPEIIEGLESFAVAAFEHFLGGPSSSAARGQAKVLALSAICA